MFRKKLLAGAATVLGAIALSAGGGAAAQATTPAGSSGELKPFYGNISPFYGNISPFYGNISPFWGNISPFWGNISPFSGNVAPFWGNISPFYGNISPFWGNISPFWGNISPFMEGLQNLPQGSDANGLLNSLYQGSEAFWGGSVQAQTGQSFHAGFAAELLARYGLSREDASAFDAMSDVDRARFLFDWYDGLMAFSGRDHVDHWMGTTNWSPAFAQTVGGGTGVTIGMFDFSANSDQVTTSIVDWLKGSSDESGLGHGDAVAGIMVGAHDSRGVMGVAPNASVVGYNPFDSTGTTNWGEIENGIKRLKQSGASVVNMSLGVPGLAFAPEWASTYTKGSIKGVLDSTVFVHAAGNDGVAQTANIAWNFNLDPTVIIVGSVGPSGEISEFSNRPGQACLTNRGVCQEPLMNRFLVASGEWILTDNGDGLTRLSGTSFAAPQVTGAIALLQGRWPWLKDHARETADIILGSATDLGAPGVDAVYGHGLLNLEASQSPLNSANLYVRSTSGAKSPPISISGTGFLGASGGYVTVFEDVGSTYRDFKVPLDATVTSTTSAVSTLEAYLASLNSASSAPATSLKAPKKPNGKKFIDDASAFAVATPLGLDVHMRLAPLPFSTGSRDGELPFALDMMVEGETLTLFAGRGAGAVALARSSTFDAASFAIDLGGANPILGLASGGGYVAAESALGAGLSLSAGFTSREHDPVIADAITGEAQPMFRGYAPYRSSAAHALVRRSFAESVSVSAAYTHLREQDGLLGLQSINPDAFAAGNDTDAASFGVEWSATARYSFAASATFARTRAHDADGQSFTVGEDGVTSSAYEAVLDINGVFGEADTARIRFSQPLHVDGGSLVVNNLEVLDRATGELGLVTQRVDLGTAGRQYFIEGLYRTPIFDGQGQLDLFARFGASERQAVPVEEIIGGQFKLRF